MQVLALSASRAGNLLESPQARKVLVFRGAAHKLTPLSSGLHQAHPMPIQPGCCRHIHTPRLD